jgi:hypothetical protein
LTENGDGEVLEVSVIAPLPYTVTTPLPDIVDEELYRDWIVDLKI